MSTLLNKIGMVNSVSYQDLVGLLSGITRTLGEFTSDFKARVEENALSQKSHSYIGTLQNINTRLGLSIYEAFSYSSSQYANLTYAFGKIVLQGTAGTQEIPTLTVSPDGFWNWRMISDVVKDINAVAGCTAVLIGQDAPCLTLAKQMNTGWVINEPVTTQTYLLSKAALMVPGSEIFSSPTSNYSIVNGVVTLTAQPTSLSISYKYMKNPYNVVASQGAMLSLTDPSLENYVIYNNDLIYQVKEAIQTLMNNYASYWAE